MLTRRHIRVKVLQSIYAYNQSENKDIEKQEKFLLYNMEQMQDLYLLMLQLLIALRDQAENYLLISQKKYLATDLEKKPSKLFIDNKVISLLNSNETFTGIIRKRKLNYWENDSEYITIIFNELK
jgi:N utilization substance protein B